MANEDKLEKAYNAIGLLQAKGRQQLSVVEVAKVAGLARSTFYLKDKDWNEVLDVIAGKHSNRVKLVQIEVTHGARSNKKISDLASRVDEFEAEVDRIEDMANTVYHQLIDEVQRWFAQAMETPAKQAHKAHILKELNDTRAEVQFLREQNKLLEAQIKGDSNVKHFVKKETIDIPNEASVEDAYSAFLDKLAAYGPHSGTRNLVAVYVLCGLPHSGKTTWIKKHQPQTPGLHLYIDYSSHLSSTRKFFIERIRKLSQASIHCVLMRANAQICSERSAYTRSGALNVQKQAEIQKLQGEFHTVSLEEPFNSFILE